MFGGSTRQVQSFWPLMHETFQFQKSPSLLLRFVTLTKSRKNLQWNWRSKSGIREKVGTHTKNVSLISRELKKGENPQASLDMDTMRSICTSKPTFANSIPEGKELFDGEKFGESVNQSVSYVSDFLHRVMKELIPLFLASIHSQFIITGSSTL